MHKIGLALLVLPLVFLASCSDKPAPPPTASAPTSAAPAASRSPSQTMASSGEVQKKLQEVAGSGAANCGDVKTLSGAEISTASQCAMQAAKGKKPFLVSYSMPGMTVGVAGDAKGKLFTVQSEEEAGKAVAPKLQECPAELRVAQSGRVTCFPPGSMGVMPGSANPHAGQGGVAVPPLIAPNPHKTTAPAATQKSH